MGGTTRNLAQGGVPGAPDDKGILASAKVVGRDAGFCEDNGFEPDCDENYNWQLKVDSEGCVSGKYVDNFYAVQGDKTSTLIQLKGDIDCAAFLIGSVIFSGTVTGGFDNGKTFAAGFKRGGFGGPQYTSYIIIDEGKDCFSALDEIQANLEFIPIADNGDKGTGQNFDFNPPEGIVPGPALETCSKPWN